MTRHPTLRATFDSVAMSYQDARPDHPDQLYADLLDITGLRPPAHLLEVGCGPGKATIPLAQQGFRIVAVELGERLSSRARQQLAPYPEVSVVTSSFEDWEPAGDTATHVGDFDLAYSATAWHWIDPEVRYAKAARFLRPGGHLAIWGCGHAFPIGFDPFFTEIQAVYNEIGEVVTGTWPPPPPDEHLDPTANEFEESGRFDVVDVRTYVWGMRYSADAYLALLDTFSGHIAMPPANREYLYAEIRRRLAERPDGQLTRHWSCVLTVGRKR